MVSNDVHDDDLQIIDTTDDECDEYDSFGREELAEWLSPLNFPQIQSSINKIRQGGTGDWVLDDERFKGWKRGDVKTLWCPGIPGAGKTVLASYIIDNLAEQHNRDSDNAAVVYLYCNHKDRSTQTGYNLVASLLKQLVQDFTPTFERVKVEYKSHREREVSPTLSEVRNTLIKEVAELSRVFVVVDALDEVSEDDSRAELLYNLQALGVSLLVTSRDIPTIGAALRGNQRMDIRARSDDICQYIEGRIRSESHLARLGRLLDKRPNLKQKVLDCLLEKAQGMFLLCRLHLDILACKITARGILDALDHLPMGIDDAYDETMKRINALDEECRLLALKTIMLITNTFRPLHKTELLDVIAFSSDLCAIDQDDLVDEIVILDICTGLLIIGADNSVRFIHHTAQEHFEKYPAWPFLSPHAEITKICLGVLSLPWSRAIGFERYAKQYLGNHARGPIEATNQAMIQEFLSCHESIGRILHRALDFARGSVFHLCAYFGLAQTIYRLENSDIVDQRNEDGDTPLHIAAQEGHVAVIQPLLDRGHDVNLGDLFGLTSLSIAVLYGKAEVAKLLSTRRDVDINLKGNRGRTPLSYAAERGMVEVVRLLLTRCDIDIESKGTDDRRTPLSYAAAKGMEEVVRLLLTRCDVDINSRDFLGRTPLSHAIENGMEEVAKLLLTRRDIDINSKDAFGGTPLSYATAKGKEEVAKLLLTRCDVVINSRDFHGRTPLSYAIENGMEEVAKLLLTRRDVDINSRNPDVRTPLSYAAKKKRVIIVQLLLSREDIVLHPRDINVCMALVFSPRAPYVRKLARLFLTRGASANFRVSCKSKTPLCLAAWHGDEKSEIIIGLRRNQRERNPKVE